MLTEKTSKAPYGFVLSTRPIPREIEIDDFLNNSAVAAPKNVINKRNKSIDC